MANRVIVATTDVPLHERRHLKGTEFEVVDAPDPKALPVQIDQESARRWLRQEWAVDKSADGKAPK